MSLKLRIDTKPVGSIGSLFVAQGTHTSVVVGSGFSEHVQADFHLGCTISTANP